MSWSIEVMGTKAGAAAKVAAELDKTAANYAGKPEADDVLACKARILALIDATVFSDGFNAIVVKANGSHYSLGTGVGSASFQVDVRRTTLALE